jgi:flagellar biogenesis protein FliO
MARMLTGRIRTSRCAAARRCLVVGFIVLASIAGRASAEGDSIAEIGHPIAPATPSAVEASNPSDSSSRGIAAPSGSFAGDAVRTVVALGAVLALALVVRHIAKKLVDPLAARRPSGVVQVLGRFPVAKGQSIMLLSVGTRVICAHQAAGRMETLCEFSDPQEIAQLRTRIEAGTPGREKFERELVRSLERDEPADAAPAPAATKAAAQPRRTLPAPRPAVATAPIVTETIDLTKRARGGLSPMRLVGVRA